MAWSLETGRSNVATVRCICMTGKARRSIWPHLHHAMAFEKCTSSHPTAVCSTFAVSVRLSHLEPLMSFSVGQHVLFFSLLRLGLPIGKVLCRHHQNPWPSPSRTCTSKSQGLYSEGMSPVCAQQLSASSLAHLHDMRSRQGEAAIGCVREPTARHIHLLYLHT